MPWWRRRFRSRWRSRGRCRGPSVSPRRCWELSGRCRVPGRRARRGRRVWRGRVPWWRRRFRSRWRSRGRCRGPSVSPRRCRGSSGRCRVPGRRARRAPLWTLRARSLWPPRRGPGRRHRSPRERSRSRPRRGRGRPPRLPRRCCRRRRRRPGPVLMPWRPSARRKRTRPPRAARSRASRAPRSPGVRAPGRALRGRTRASRGPPRRVRGRPRGRFAARRPARPSARPLPTAPRGSGREARRMRAPPRSPLAVASASLRPDVPRRPRSCRRASPLRSSHWPPWSLPSCCRRLRHLPTRREIPPRSSALVTIVTCLGTIDERPGGGSGRRCRRIAAGETRTVYTGRVPSGDDFDFWLGTWEVRWGPTGQETGRNVITRLRRSRGSGALRRSSGRPTSSA